MPATKDRATAFVAYPAEPKTVSESILGAVELAEGRSLGLSAWEKMPVLGFKIDDLIHERLQESDCLVADITFSNFNVYYEIGYALALEKPVIPIVNTSISSAAFNVRKTGLFDNIGWLEYNNAGELSEKLEAWTQRGWIEKYEKAKDHAQPLFILDTLAKTDFRQYIFQAVEGRSVNYRFFDPLVVPRLTASRAIADVSASAGCIIPILEPNIVDADLHNLRGAFLAGLCHGFEIEPLIIQYGTGPAPLDYRDYVTNTNSRTETHRHVEEYCGKVLIRNQAASAPSKKFKLGLLNRIDVGASAAENESVSLSNYFIGTAEYSRALRSDHALVVGRKGSGKTAIYYQVRNALAREKFNFIVELRPATHNLSELRQELLAVSNEGIFDHTIAAFWTYILYVELLLKIREYVIPLTARDFALQNRIRDLESELRLDETVVSGDFTSRLNNAIVDVVATLQAEKGSKRSVKAITNLVYETSIPRLRDLVISFSDQYDEIVLLIDDIDKGWPPRQLERHDAMTIRHLIESMRRIERDLRKKSVKFRSLMFLRGDVYETLVDNTSDRGKYNPINVDWSDSVQLSRLLKTRVGSSFLTDESKEEAWDFVNVVMPDGRYAIDHLIKAALFRPRFLIEACEKVLSTAINRGNHFVTPEDVMHGLEQMSQYLVSDFGYELRDVSGVPEDIFYRFIGVTELLTEREIGERLSHYVPLLDLPSTVDLLLWYGFLGIASASSPTKYIFDVGYDFRRIRALQGFDRNEVLYQVNEAFLRGLDIN